jgi:3-dehydroquinate synthetase
MTAPLKHSDPITVDVALGDRGYDIIIGRGVLASLGPRIARLRPGVRTAVVTDRTVAKHWLESTQASLVQAGIPAATIVVEEGEGSKSYAGLEKVSEALIAAKIERNDLVIALGGGVVGDLAGFAAAILRRGVDFVQVPTSLLAQVDSSVGGKTGINSPQGKNLLGAFHQPVLVVADTAVLDTLSPRQFRAGYAEVAKYGLLGDASFFAWLEANHADIVKGGAAREHAIATSCRAKAATGCSMARASRSAWCWRRNSPPSSVCCIRATLNASLTILAMSACRRICRTLQVLPRKGLLMPIGCWR